jgi:hypothetical protein
MATGSSMPPMLNLKKSDQSGVYTLTGAWQTIYTESCLQPYLFVGAEIDLSNMAALDVVDIRIRKRLTLAGAWINHDQVQYIGAMPAGHVAVHIGSLPDIYGIEISAIQSVGAFRIITCEIFHAKRLGL